MALTCLDTLVGLSEATHSCFTDERPADYDGTSGYYITDPDYGINIIDNCEAEGWTMLSAARSKAIQEFKTDLRAKMRGQNASTVNPFNGVIGRRSATSFESNTQTYLGHLLKPLRLKGGKFVLETVYLGLTTTDSFTMTIASNDPDFSSLTDAVTSTAGTFKATTLSTEREIPFWSNNDLDTLEYYLYIEPGSGKGLNNSFSCCGNHPTWQKYFTVEGFQSDDLDTFTIFGSGAGFALGGYLTCEELDWICEVEKLNGYFLLDVIARTIQFRAAAIVLGRLLDSQKINICTTLNAEMQQQKRAFLNGRYSENIDWIAQNIPANVTDCFTCNDQQSFYKRSLIL